MHSVSFLDALTELLLKYWSLVRISPSSGNNIEMLLLLLKLETSNPEAQWNALQEPSKHKKEHLWRASGLVWADYVILTIFFCSVEPECFGLLAFFLQIIFDVVLQPCV